MIKKQTGFYIFLGLVLVVSISCEYSNLTQIYIFYTNDIHGYIYPASCFDKDSTCCIGGFPTLSNYIKKMKREYILVDAGDFFQGTPEGIYNGGKSVAEIMNIVGYDLAVPGNHEFDLGYKNFTEIANSADFNFTLSNILDTSFNKHPEEFSRFYILTINGVNVGFFGLLTKDVSSITKWDNPNLLVYEPLSSAKNMVEYLRRNNADIIIAITHLGFEGETRPYEGDIYLSENVKGIDVIIGGHSHTPIRKPYKIENTYIVQAGSHLRYLGQLCILYDKNKRKVVSVKNWLIPLYTNKWGVDNKVLSKVTELKLLAAKDLDSVIGFAVERIPRREENSIESPLGNLITDIMRTWSKADIALQNSGGIRADIPEGEITKRTIYNVQPFDNTVVVARLTGKNIFEIIEQSLVNRYGGLQVSGMKIYLKRENNNLRLVDIFVNDEKLDTSAEYTVATNSFLAYGGEGYEFNKRAKSMSDTGINLRELIISYVRENKRIQPVHRNRFIEE